MKGVTLTLSLCCQECQRQESDDENTNRSGVQKFGVDVHRFDSLGNLLSAGDSGLMKNTSPGSSGCWTASSSSPRALCARATASNLACPCGVGTDAANRLVKAE